MLGARPAQLPLAATEKAIGEISFEARGLTSADTTSSRRTAGFLRRQQLIKNMPDLGTVLLHGWCDRHAR
ncbi:hypothetical protein SALBM135S_02478 [Streptomyces alboniger]